MVCAKQITVSHTLSVSPNESHRKSSFFMNNMPKAFLVKKDKNLEDGGMSTADMPTAQVAMAQAAAAAQATQVAMNSGAGNEIRF